MDTVSQRQLRNDNGELVRQVEKGASYVVTRRGVPVARLVPIESASDLRCVRPAAAPRRFVGRRLVDLAVTSTELLDDARGDR